MKITTTIAVLSLLLLPSICSAYLDTEESLKKTSYEWSDAVQDIHILPTKEVVNIKKSNNKIDEMAQIKDTQDKSKLENVVDIEITF